MKRIMLLLVGIIIILGCAKVQVQAPKDPIKVDISMRLDIYQHVEKDIDAIESIVSGAKAKSTDPDKQSFLDRVLPSAYAQELSPEVEKAALRRKDRYQALVEWEQKGVIGENRSGMVEVRKSSGDSVADATIRQIVSGENSDRLVIYGSVAKKNGTSIEEVKRLYAQRLQGSAPQGTPIEGASGWQVK